MIQRTLIKDISSDTLSPFLEKLNNHNLNNIFEETSSLSIGVIANAFAVYRYPSATNFPTYSISEPPTVYQDTWYEKGDTIALYLLKAPFEFNSSLLSSIQEKLLKSWVSTEDKEFYIKALKADTFMNMPLTRSRWSLFCWCNGNLLIISFEPESGIITLDCANAGAEWNENTEEAFDLIFSVLEDTLGIE